MLLRPLSLSPTMPTPQSDAEAKFIHARLDDIAGDLKSVTGEISKLLIIVTELRAQQQSVATQLTTGAQRMQDHEARLQSIERDLPGLRELRKWVIGAVISVVTLLGGALVKLVVYDVPRPPQAQVQVPPVSTGVK